MASRRDGREYSVSTWLLPWYEAQGTCRAYGGELSSAASSGEHDFLLERFPDVAARFLAQHLTVKTVFQQLAVQVVHAYM